MKTSQSFIFYPTDFVMGTALLSVSEVGAYIRLLCYQWQEGSLPSDETVLARLAQCSIADIHGILPKFHAGTDGKLRNKRLEAVRKELISSRKRRSDAGKLGGRPKKAMLSDRLSNEKAIQSSPCTSPLPCTYPSTSTKEETNTPSVSLTEFDQFWSLYPRRDGKHNAKKAWAKAKPDLETVKVALAWQTLSYEWTKDNGQFVPHAATYLNQRRFEDENPNATGSLFGATAITQQDEEEEEPFHVIFARNKAKRDAEQGIDAGQPPTAEELSLMEEETTW